MHIKKLTLTLPARMAKTADRDARQIAQEIAKQMAQLPKDQIPSTAQINIQDNGANHYALSNQIAQQVVASTKGTGFKGGSR